jgi:hypothetical protein
MLFSKVLIYDDTFLRNSDCPSLRVIKKCIITNHTAKGSSMYYSIMLWHYELMGEERKICDLNFNGL